MAFEISDRDTSVRGRSARRAVSENSRRLSPTVASFDDNTRVARSRRNVARELDGSGIAAVETGVEIRGSECIPSMRIAGRWASPTRDADGVAVGTGDESRAGAVITNSRAPADHVTRARERAGRDRGRREKKDGCVAARRR